MRRVVVTGLGAVTPLGNTVQDFWTNLIAGTSGAATITHFDTAAYDTHFACELKNYKATDYLDRKGAQRMDPFTQFAMISCDQAVKDAKIVIADDEHSFAEACLSLLASPKTCRDLVRRAWKFAHDRHSPAAVRASIIAQARALVEP